MPDIGGRLTTLVQSRRAALALIVLGVVVIAAGLLQTTASHLNNGNAPCPSGTTLIAKFNAEDGKYHFEKPAGNEHVVTITHGTAKGGTWDSQIAISHIVVKGGSHAVITSFAPPSLHGQFSNAGLPPVGKGKQPDISNIEFCAPTPTSSTTTSTTTSTSTVPRSTSTTPGTTTPTTAPIVSTTTTTETPVTEATTVAPPTVPPTTAPRETTTTTTETSPATEATTVPNSPSTAAGATSTVPAITTPTTVFERGVTSTTVVPAPADAQVGSGSLPRTGSPSLPLIAFGTVLLAAGAALVIVGRRRHWA